MPRQRAPRPVPAPPVLTEACAGTVLARRYLLRAQVGADAAIDARYWWATDLRYETDVAVTLLHGPSYLARAEWTTELMNSVVRSEQLEHPGCARLVDVLRKGSADLPPGVLGMAVNEWVPGRSLAAVVADGAVRPATAVQIIEPLADAAQLAHRQGMVLGCKQFQRIRVTPDRRAVIAFPMPRPETTTDSDVHGLGAALYALLTARWPQPPLGSSDTNGAAWTAGRGLPLGVPHELATLVASTLGEDRRLDRVCSADVVYEVLADLLASEQDTVLLPPVGDVVTEPYDIWLRNEPVSSLTDPDKRRKLGVALAGLGAGLLTAAGYVGLQMLELTGGHTAPPIVVPDGTAAASTEVEVTDLDVYQTDAEKPVESAMGGQTAAAGIDDQRQRLPVIGPGIGVMASFATPVRLESLSISSPSEGAQIELRSAPRLDMPFEAMKPIAKTTLRAGVTEVPLRGTDPVHHVLVRIVEAGGARNAAELDQVIFRKAGGCGQQPQLPYSTSGWICGR